MLEIRAAATIIRSLDELATCREGTARVAVIATALDPQRVGPGLRRAGRFDSLLLSLRSPDEKCRRQLLQLLLPPLQIGIAAQDVKHVALHVPARELCEKSSTDAEMLTRQVATSSAGYSPADLANVCREAVLHARGRDAAVVNWQDFSVAIGATRPSVLASFQRQVRYLG